MTPDQLIETADRLVGVPSLHTEGWWSRAAVLLLRQALEGALGELVVRAGGETGASFTAQLTVLPVLVDDDELARDVAWTWAALSGASHAHSYELPPSAVEIEEWAAVVRRAACWVVVPGGMDR